MIRSEIADVRYNAELMKEIMTGTFGDDLYFIVISVRNEATDEFFLQDSIPYDIISC